MVRLGHAVDALCPLHHVDVVVEGARRCSLRLVRDSMVGRQKTCRARDVLVPASRGSA